jgi:3-oxoacyl-[acyl-carrier-protein] synthase-3
MRYSDVYVAGVANWLPPLRPVSAAISAGRYDAAEQAANRYESVAVAGPDDAPPDMAIRAARLALERSGTRPGDVALLLHAYIWYQGVDFWSAAPYIHHAVLGDTRLCPAIDVGQLSAGAMGALELAASYLQASPDRAAALVTAADRFHPPGFDRWRTDIPSIVYGDGAAALVLSRNGGLAQLIALSTVVDTSLEPMYRGDSPFGAVSVAASGPIDVRGRRDAHLRHNERAQVIGQMTESLVTAVSAVLSDAGLALADISRFVFPNVGYAVLCARYLEPLGLDPAQTAWEWGRTTAHVGAADQLTGLAYLAERGQAAAGDRVMLVGIGAGFTWSCAILQWREVPPATS